MGKLYTPRQVSEILNISYITIKRWLYDGKIKGIKLPNGRWRIPEEEINKILQTPIKPEAQIAIYARVSSHDRKQDLERQVQNLKNYAATKGWKIAKEYTDIASGLNTKRPGLKKLFKAIENKEIDKVLITYKDRLTRFGYEYIEEFFNSYGVEIISIFGDEQKTPEAELVEDMLSIVTSFAGKLYGQRSHKKKRIIECIKNEVKS